jgi:hypothetical protein
LLFARCIAIRFSCGLTSKLLGVPLFVFFKWVLVAKIVKGKSNGSVIKGRRADVHNDFDYTNRFSRSFRSGLDGHLLNGVQDIFATHEFAKHGVLFVKVGCWSECKVPL